ncbi:MAG: recombinase RecA [Pseudomonadota bacterium]|jgi:RecA/RadA recombinase
MAKEILGGKNILSSHLKDNKDSHYNFEDEQIFNVSTGSLLLDSELGGSLEVPAIVRFTGVSGGGKTSAALLIMNNFLKTIPNAKGLLIKAEGRLNSNVKRISGVDFVDKPEDWDNGKCFVLRSNVYENIATLILELIQNNPENTRYYFLVDSMDALISKNDLSKGFDDSAKVAAGAVLTSNFLRRIMLPLSTFGHICGLISQVRSNVQINPYAKGDPKLTNSSGGNALQHYADWIFEFQPRYKSDQIIEDGKIIGHWSKILLRKTTNEKDGTEITYPIRHGRSDGKSVWLEYEIADMLIQWGFAKKSGAWIAFDAGLIKDVKEDTEEIIPEKIQGMDQLRTFLEENSKICNYLFNKFKIAFAK